MEKKIKLPAKAELASTTIRIDKDLLDKYDEIAGKTNRSRNEVISTALRYAVDLFDIEDKNS